MFIGWAEDHIEVAVDGTPPVFMPGLIESIEGRRDDDRLHGEAAGTAGVALTVTSAGPTGAPGGDIYVHGDAGGRGP